MDDRKLRILAAVVDEYVTTGEPVGSKTIAALPDIHVSAATIRTAAFGTESHRRM